MRRIVTLLTALTLTLTGCMPADGTSPNGHGPDPNAPSVAPEGEYDPTIQPNYTVLVSTFRESGRNAQGIEIPVRRELLCTVIGKGRTGAPIIVTDVRTGVSFSYSIPVSARTPAKIPISTYGAPDLFTLEILCSALNLRPREVMYCEFKLGDENGPEAPLLMAIRRNDAHYESGITGMMATCGGRINVLA